jgi:ADP-ribose pyrophosphatase YjhB (NUDIX family)
MPQIVIKAMLIVRNGEKLFFSRGFDEVKGQAFLRPLGGHVEFGERGEETIRREMKEELGCDISHLHFLGVLENLFSYRGKSGHDIILAYEGELTDKSLYQKSAFTF